jgi:hypothetical protein
MNFSEDSREVADKVGKMGRKYEGVFVAVKYKRMEETSRGQEYVEANC